MKHIKKLICLLLALSMILALGVSSFAAQSGNGTGSITINNTVPGQTYTIYRIFDLESHSGDNYSYKVVSDWANFFAAGAAGSSYITIDADGYMRTWIGDDTAERHAEFAQKALTYAAENNIAINPENKPDDWDSTVTFVSEKIKAAKETVKFDNIDLGYYLIDTTLGALCALTTTSPNATVTEKNAQPTIEKQVKEDSTLTWGSWNDADIGQTVEFKTTISAQKGAQNYVLHDNMSQGLTIDTSSIKITSGSQTLTKGTDYTVAVDVSHLKADNTADFSCDFEISFAEDFLSAITASTDIVVEYTAKVNKDAVIADNGNPNETWLTYGDENSTQKVKTVTYIWKLDIFKYTGTDTPLAGAVFSLYTDSECTKIMNLVQKNNDIGEAVKNTYLLCADSECAHSSHITQITTDSDGKLFILGLDADTYYLKEIAAPVGYNKIPAPISVTVTSSEDSTTNTVTFSLSGDDNTVVEVENNTGALLPSTGGRGAALLYIFGGALAVGAAVLLIVQKRMSMDK